MALPLDDTDIAILCTLLDKGWSTSSDVVSENRHEILKKSASDAVRYRLLRLVGFGLVREQRARTIRKRQEFSVLTDVVRRLDECALVEESGNIVPIGEGILTFGKDFNEHHHE